MLTKVKKVIVKNRKIFLVWLVVWILCAGCSAPEVEVAQPTIDHPPYCEDFLKVQGKPLDEVLSALGLNIASFTHKEGKEQYIFNEPVEFLGYPFEMQFLTYLTMDPPSEAVVGVRYVLKAETPEAGAEIVADLRDKLLKGYGAAYNSGKSWAGDPDIKTTNPPSPLNHYTKEDLLDLFTRKGGGCATLEWLLAVDLTHIPEEIRDRAVFPYTCITATLNSDYPVTDMPEKDQAPYVLIELIYTLSNSY